MQKLMRYAQELGRRLLTIKRLASEGDSCSASLAATLDPQNSTINRSRSLAVASS